MRFTVILERDRAGGFVATVPLLPGCVSQGETRADVLSNIREAIAAYLEEWRASGRTIPDEAGREFVDVDI
jgi:predicted RNase H-like HicB family nuclease